MKRKLFLCIICILFFVMSGCGNLEDNPPDLEAIMDSEKVKECLESYTITDKYLEKRQVYKEQKLDVAYVHIQAEKNSGYTEFTIMVNSSYYDVGGWQIESAVIIDEPEFMIKDYLNVEDTEIDEGAYDITIDKLESECVFSYKVDCAGKIINQIFDCETRYKFNKYSGEWEIIDKLSEVIEIKINDITGKWGDIDGATMSFDIIMDDEYMRIAEFENLSSYRSFELVSSSSKKIEYKDGTIGWEFSILDKNVYSKLKIYSNLKEPGSLKFSVINSMYGNTYLSGYLYKIEDINIIDDSVRDDIYQQCMNNNIDVVKEILKDYGIEKIEVEWEYSEKIEENKVIRINIEGNGKTRLIVSMGIDEGSYLVPDFKNMTVSQAKIVAEENGLKLQILQEVNSDTVEKDRIISQSISANTVVPAETVIDIIVSKGK